MDIGNIKDINNIEEFEEQFSTHRTEAIIEALYDYFTEDNYNIAKDGIVLLDPTKKENTTLPEGHMEENYYGHAIIDKRVIYFDMEIKTDNVWDFNPTFKDLEINEFHLDYELTRENLNKITRKKINGFKVK
jgi:hypothetical protein